MRVRYPESMNISTFVFVLIFAASGPVIAQAPMNWQNAEREKLLAGVEAIPRLGSPGPVAIWGTFAFPVIAAAEGGKAEMALAAAAGFGKGKVLIFGHNSYVEAGGVSGGSAGTLLLNAITWSSGKQKPRVGLFKTDLVGYLEKHGLRAKKITGELKKSSLNDFDVVIANAQSLTDVKEGEAVRDFIKAGGGFIAGMTGWAFEQTSGGKSLASAHGLNAALMPIGIAFTDSSGFGNAQLREFKARTDLPKLMNAAEAISAISTQSKGGATLSADDLNQSASAIQLAIAAQPPGRTSLQAAVMAALGDGASGVPTPKAPLTQAKSAPERIRLGMETRLLKMASGADVKPHPSAGAFPGVAPSDAPKVMKEVGIDPNIPGWASTGLWLNAGDPLSIKVPAEMVEKGFAIRIGCHTDTLYHLESWSRAPDVSRSVPIDSATLTVASAFGGLVYVEVPGRAAGGEVMKVAFAGAVEAPFFVLGRDDDARWNNVSKKLKAPWAELACDKVVLCCPAEVAKRVANPTQLMTFWKAVIEAQDEISNQAGERRRPERIVADVQISAGYMHSGYPIMVPVSAAEEMVTFSKLKFPGWGYYHELGHNHQRGEFTFEGTGEVTNNVLGMWVYQKVLNKDPLLGHPAISPAAQKEHIQKIKRASGKFAVWKSEPFVALTTYIQLVEGFGWEAWRKYLHSFADSSFGPVPSNDDEKRDQFLVRYSKITNKNLSEFFDWWGIPVSSAAKSEVSRLDKWMPKGLH